MTASVKINRRNFFAVPVIAAATVAFAASAARALPRCDTQGARRGYVCQQPATPTPAPTPIDDPSESWVTNQGGGEKACDTTRVPAAVETQVSSDNAGPIEADRLWSYLISGYLRLYNPNDFPVRIEMTPYTGGGEWTPENGPVGVFTGTVDTYEIAAGQETNVPFRTRDWLVGDHFDGFWITIISDAPVVCEYTNYDTTEHD